MPPDPFTRDLEALDPRAADLAALRGAITDAHTTSVAAVTQLHAALAAALAALDRLDEAARNYSG
jgi:hypothetical protein